MPYVRLKCWRKLSESKFQWCPDGHFQKKMRNNAEKPRNLYERLFTRGIDLFAIVNTSGWFCDNLQNFSFSVNNFA